MTLTSTRTRREEGEAASRPPPLPLTLSDLHPSLRELLGIHEALRRFGFASSEIFVANSAGDSHPAVIVHAQGKEFTVTSGIEYTGDEKAFLRDWHAAAALWNAAEPEEHEQVWSQTIPPKHAHHLYFVLLRKGFVPVGKVAN